MVLMSPLLRAVMLCVLVFWPAFSAAARPDAVTPDGGRWDSLLLTFVPMLGSGKHRDRKRAV